LTGKRRYRLDSDFRPLLRSCRPTNQSQHCAQQQLT
jgi:hypothetical protein